MSARNTIKRALMLTTSGIFPLEYLKPRPAPPPLETPVTSASDSNTTTHE
jgi:hypothetical protein